MDVTCWQRLGTCFLDISAWEGDCVGQLWQWMGYLVLLTIPAAFYFPVMFPEKQSEQEKLKSNLRGKEMYLVGFLALSSNIADIW